MTRLLLTRASLAEGTRVLRARDPKLRPWMDRVGRVELRRQRHQFGALCRSILAQQLAAAAAKTIYARFLALHAPARTPNPRRVLEFSTASLRRCGISHPKVRYLRALAKEFHDGTLSRLRLFKLSDAEVVDHLTQVPGVGVWTAQMFLIFSLGRLDVFSVGDLALRNAVQRVQGRAMAPPEIETTARRWAPYRSVASLHLWKIAHWKE